MILLLLTAAAYFYFHWQYFNLVKKLNEQPCRRIWLVFLGFVINYLFFILCSVLEFPLVLNWFLFAFLLFGETLLYDNGDKRCALFSTLLGILYGLSTTIICRSIVAIVLSQPLQNFDNHTSSAVNEKGIPVLLGFLLAGVILQFMKRTAIVERIRLILRHPKQQSFLLEMMGGLFFYLFINLLLYSTPLNDLLLKLWSLKSCLFCIIGFYIAARYTKRVCELGDYREKNWQMEQELEKRRIEEEQLRQQASLDVLTGLQNRQAADETLASMTQQQTGFTLCFLDLDGLKNVNDRYGHEEGDRYIITVAEQIHRACRSGSDWVFRYGGDEFLVLFVGLPADRVVQRAEVINESLRSLDGFAYPLSVSYGVIQSTQVPDWRELVQWADRAMYEQKRQKHAVRE